MHTYKAYAYLQGVRMRARPTHAYKAYVVAGFSRPFMYKTYVVAGFSRPFMYKTHVVAGFSRPFMYKTYVVAGFSRPFHRSSTRYRFRRVPPG
jgi:hypothetical protein